MRVRRLSTLTRIRTALLAGTTVLLSACSIFTGGDCVDLGGYAIRLTVVDSATGGPPTSTASLTAQDGTYAESLPSPVTQNGEQLFLVGFERAGTYDLVVQATGYETWRRDDVRAQRSGDCDDLRTVSVRARLVRR